MARNRMGDRALLAKAAELTQRFGGQIQHRDQVAIADYGAPSWKPRMHLIDLEAGRVNSLLVAHGSGSDPAHTGWLDTFSNVVGSNASSRGGYVTDVHYDGKYGRSIRLSGLETDNSNAYRRAIVMHPAWYVGEEMIGKYGKLGRSQGCFAFAEADMAEVLARLGPGRLVYSGKLSA